MTRAEVRAFVKAGVDALTPVLEFGCGLISDFNIKPDKTLPQVWQELRAVEGENPSNQAPVDDWDIRLHIAQLDKTDSTSDQYNQIVDACDLVAQQLLAQYNVILSSDRAYRKVTLSDRVREPFVKKHAHVMSGVILRFNIHAPDTTEVC